KAALRPAMPAPTTIARRPSSTSTIGSPLAEAGYCYNLSALGLGDKETSSHAARDRASLEGPPCVEGEGLRRAAGDSRINRARRGGDRAHRHHAGGRGPGDAS